MRQRLLALGLGAMMSTAAFGACTGSESADPNGRCEEDEIELRLHAPADKVNGRQMCVHIDSMDALAPALAESIGKVAHDR